MAKSWSAAPFMEQIPSADSRATTSPGSILSPAWRTRLTRTRTVPSCQLQCRPMGRSWRPVVSSALEDRRAGHWPGSMGRPAWLMLSTQIRLAGVKQTTWGVAGGVGTIGGQSRIGIARLDAATGLADSFDPHPDLSVEALAVQGNGTVF